MSYYDYHICNGVFAHEQRMARMPRVLTVRMCECVVLKCAVMFVTDDRRQLEFRSFIRNRHFVRAFQICLTTISNGVFV